MLFIADILLLPREITDRFRNDTCRLIIVRACYMFFLSPIFYFVTFEILTLR